MMADVIPLKYGPIFKRAFSKPSIFQEFVEAVTGVQVNVGQMLFVNPRLVNENTPATVKPWLEIIKDSLDKKIDESAYPSPRLQGLVAKIQRNTMSAEESTAIKDESTWAKAVARHREEARRDQQIETAKVMLSKGLDHALIAEVTWLSTKEIAHLLEEM